MIIDPVLLLSVALGHVLGVMIIFGAGYVFLKFFVKHYVKLAKKNPDIAGFLGMVPDLKKTLEKLIVKIEKDNP